MIHGNRVFGNTGLQSGVMVSSRRISRACSKAKYQGKRRRLRALRPVHHNLSGGKASARRRSPVCPRARRISYFCENIAMLPRGTICSQSFCKRSRPKWRTRLSRRLWSRGRTRSGRCSKNCHGARFGEAALASEHEGQAHFLGLEEFAMLPRRAKCSHSCCQKS